jgi:integrase
MATEPQPHKSKKGIVTWQVKVRREGIYQTKTFPTKKMAQDWARNLENQIIQRTYLPSLEEKSPNHTVDELIDEFCQRILPQREVSTQKTYTKLLGWWRETLKGIDVKSIDSKLIEKYKYFLLLDKHYSPARVNLYLASLSSAFSYAASDPVNWVSSNPCFKVKRFPDEPRKPKITDAQREILIRECSKNKSPYLHLYVQLVLGTGGRAKEIMNLRWYQIDLKAHTIEFRNTKNKQDLLVPLGPNTYQLLKEHHEQMFKEFLRTSKGHFSEFGNIPVFLSRIRPGRPVVNLWKSWNKVRCLAGLPKFRVHDMRHVYANTLAIKGGADLVDIGAVLGHKSPKSTFRYRQPNLKQLSAKIALMEEQTDLIKIRLEQRAFQRKFDFEIKE